MNAALVVIAGAVSSAMLFLSIILGSIGAILLTYLAMLPLFVIGLSRGGLYASIAGTIAALIVWATGGAHSAILYFLTCTLPASVLSDKATLSVGGGRSTAASWYPGGLLCVWLSVFPAAILIGTYLYFAAAGDGLEAAIATQIRAILGAYQDALGTRFPELGPLPLEQMGAVEDLLIRIAPGLAALIWMLATLLNGIAAQALLTRMKRNIRPSPQLAEIELPRWFIGLFAASFLAAIVLAGPVGFLPANLAAILVFPVFLSGLGVIHFAAARTRFRFGIIFLLYLFLMIWRGVAIAVVVLGLLDHFFGIRARIRGRTPQV